MPPLNNNIKKSNVLNNKTFYLDCGSSSGYKVKKDLQTFVETNSGHVSMILNQKVNFYVFYGDFQDLVKVENNSENNNNSKDIDIETLSFSIKKAIKLNIPIVSKRYLDDSVSFGSLLSCDEYSLVSKYNIKEYHYKSIDFSNLLDDSSSGNNNSEKKDKYDRIKYDITSDKFPETKYHIVKHSVLFKSERIGDRFIVIELHVAGKSLDLIQVSSTNNESSSNDNETSSYYRVFLHYGTFSNNVGSINKEISEETKEWISSNSIESALSIYNQILIEYVNQNSYSKIQLNSITIGSDKLKELYHQNQDQQKASTLDKLPESIEGLIRQLYDEAIMSLGIKFGNSNKLSLTPEGYIKTSMGDITLSQVDKAELALFQLSNLLRTTKTQIQDKESVELINEIFKALPQIKPAINVEFTFELLSDIQDTIQVMKDILSVGESLSGVSYNFGNNESKRYRALRCNIVELDKLSKDYKRLLDQLKLDNNISIKSIYKINRKDEENLKFQLSNIKTLYHGSNPQNILGILSRGLLPPNISTSIGSGRRDIGYLGSGIYFGVKSMTSVQYCKESALNQNKYMFICQVALGNCKRYTSHQIQLNSPPKGFDSVQGVQGTPTLKSDFNDDEIVIFNSKQQKIQYLVEFQDVNAIKYPSNIPKQLLDISKDQPKTTIKPDDCPTVVPPSSSKEKQHQEEEEEEKEVGLISKSSSSSSNKNDIPLKSVHVKAKVLDLIGEVTIYQHYQNNSTTNIEAKYVFPLDEMGAVCGFEAFINGKHIIGEVKEKEKAHREYKEAVAAGHGAYLMDEDKPDVFTVSVGNLPPKCDVLIKITYVTELSVDGLDISFVLPRSITPRQRLSSGSTVTQNVTKTISIDQDQQKESEFTIQVGVDMPYNIVKLISPTHNIKTKRTHTKATIELQKGDKNYLDKNFQLLIGLEEPYSPRMWVEVDEKGHHASMLAFYPKLEIDSGRDSFTHLTLLVDLSASMAGDTFEDLLRALRLTISNLRGVPKLLFNICTFGDTFDWLFVEDVLPSEENLLIAWNHINKLKPINGGTLLHQPLESLYLLSEKAKSTNPFNILLFSDGNVANEELSLMLAKKSSPICRLFTFGIGEHCSRHFMKTLSRMGGGYADFIVPNKRPNPKKIIDMIQRVLQPAMSNIHVSFDSTDKIIQSPATISSIFKSERQVIYAFSGICTRATLVCQAPGGGIVSNIVHTPEIGFIKGNLIHRLAARSMIREYNDGTYSLNKHEHDLIKLKKKQDIINLSIKYSIVTEFTSFVAIEKRVEGEQIKKLDSIHSIISQNVIDSLPYVPWEDKNEGFDQDLNDSTLISKRDQLINLIQDYHSNKRFSDSIRVFYQISETFGDYSFDELSLISNTVNSLITDKLMSFNNIKVESSSPLSTPTKSTPSSTFKTPTKSLTTTSTFSSPNSKQLRMKKKIKDEIIYEGKSLLRLLENSYSLMSNNSLANQEKLLSLIQAQHSIYTSLYSCDDNKYSKKQWNERVEYLYNEFISKSKEHQLPPTNSTLIKFYNSVSQYHQANGNIKKAISISKSTFDNAISELDCLDESTYRDSTLELQRIRDNLTNLTSCLGDEESEDDHFLSEEESNEQNQSISDKKSNEKSVAINQQENEPSTTTSTFSATEWFKSAKDNNIILKPVSLKANIISDDKKAKDEEGSYRSYSPTSPSYSPTSPSYSPTSPSYSPSYSPTSSINTTCGYGSNLPPPPPPPPLTPSKYYLYAPPEPIKYNAPKGGMAKRGSPISKLPSPPPFVQSAPPPPPPPSTGAFANMFLSSNRGLPITTTPTAPTTSLFIPSMETQQSLSFGGGGRGGSRSSSISYRRAPSSPSETSLFYQTENERSVNKEEYRAEKESTKIKSREADFSVLLKGKLSEAAKKREKSIHIGSSLPPPPPIPSGPPPPPPSFASGPPPPPPPQRPVLQTSQSQSYDSRDSLLSSIRSGSDFKLKSLSSSSKDLDQSIKKELSNRLLGGLYSTLTPSPVSSKSDELAHTLASALSMRRCYMESEDNDEDLDDEEWSSGSSDTELSPKPNTVYAAATASTTFKKKEQKESYDEDMGMGLFDDGLMPEYPKQVVLPKVSMPSSWSRADEESDEDMGFDLFGSYEDKPAPVSKQPVLSKPVVLPKAAASIPKSSPCPKADEESDEDMGFDLFGSYDESPAPKSSAFSYSSKRAQVSDKKPIALKEEEEEEEVGFSLDLFDELNTSYNNNNNNNNNNQSEEPMLKEYSRRRLSKSIQPEEPKGYSIPKKNKKKSVKEVSKDLKSIPKAPVKEKVQLAQSISSSFSSPSSSSSSSLTNKSIIYKETVNICLKIKKLTSDLITSNQFKIWLVAGTLGIHEIQLLEFERKLGGTTSKSYKNLLLFFIYVFLTMLIDETYDIDSIIADIPILSIESSLKNYGIDRYYVQDILKTSTHKSLLRF